MTQLTLIDRVACNNQLGEGVQWNHMDGCFYWTDIHGKKFYRYEFASKELRAIDVPERLCCFAFAKNDSRLLAAFESGFAWFDVNNGAIEWIAKPEAHIKGNRSNDGRCDRQGRFWMGSVVEDRNHESQSAGLYCLEKDFSVSQHFSGLMISNALCWSPDSRKLYHADSPTHSIRVYDFDAETGELSNPEIFAHTSLDVEPDGACVDAEGYVWNAQWGGSQVVRYATDGSKNLVLDLPVTQPTCVAFGGPELNLLAVTSARFGLKEGELENQPQAGSLFIFATPFTGLTESWFG